MSNKLPSFFKNLDDIESHTMTVSFGLPASGKTSFIATLPGKILVLDTDRGLESVRNSGADITSAEVNSTEELMESLKYANLFDSIALDNITSVQDMVYKEIMSKYKIDKLQIQHYGEASTTLIRLIDELIYLSKQGKNVYIIAQENVVTSENPELGTQKTTVQPLVMNSVLKHLTHNSRIIIHMEKKAQTKITNGNKKYVEVYQARLGGDPQINTKITKPKNMSVPQVVKEPTWEFISGLISGKTQAKLKEQKEKGDK